MKRQHGLDHASDSRRALGVADQALYGSYGAGFRRGAPLPKKKRQGFQFDAITQGGSRSMRFVKPDGRRRKTGLRVGSAQGANLADAGRHGHAGTTPVAGAAKSLDHRVNAVSVAFRVDQPFQNKNANAFADDNAVRCLIEGTHFAPSTRGPVSC